MSPQLKANVRAWGPSVFAVLIALGISVYRASHGSQVDIDVYLTGGKHAFSSGLYSARFEGLYFTYPPFAALIFALPAVIFGFTTVQVLWAVVNIAALAALVYLTLRAVRPDLEPRRPGAGRSCSRCRPSPSTRSSRTSGSVRSTSCSGSWSSGIFSGGAGSDRSRFHSASPPVSPRRSSSPRSSSSRTCSSPGGSAEP